MGTNDDDKGDNNDKDDSSGFFTGPLQKTKSQLAAEQLTEALLNELDLIDDPQTEFIVDFGDLYNRSRAVAALNTAVTEHYPTVDDFPWMTFVSRALLHALRRRAFVSRPALGSSASGPTTTTVNFCRLGNAYLDHRAKLVYLTAEWLEAQVTRHWRPWLAKRGIGAVALLLGRFTSRLVSQVVGVHGNMHLFTLQMVMVAKIPVDPNWREEFGLWANLWSNGSSGSSGSNINTICNTDVETEIETEGNEKENVPNTRKRAVSPTPDIDHRSVKRSLF